MHLKASNVRKKQWRNKGFTEEIVSVDYRDRKGNEITVDWDEYHGEIPRLETVKLRPIVEGGTVNRRQMLQALMMVHLHCF